MKPLIAIGMAAALVACAGGCAMTEVVDAGQPVVADQPLNAPPAEVAGPSDAQPTAQRVFQIELYQLALPQGAISRNADFWKPFDETFLGFERHAVLYRNGLRVGRAPLAELTALRGQLADAESVQDSLIGTAGKNVEMPVRSGVPRQTVFSFDEASRAEGHDFERCDNLFAVGFNQTPRRPDRVRVSIAPAVREKSPKLQPLPQGGVDWVQPFTLYKLNIVAELGIDECLVIAPSDVAVNLNVSVGRTFMMEERPSERVEKVLVVVPRLRGTLQEQPASAAR